MNKVAALAMLAAAVEPPGKRVITPPKPKVPKRFRNKFAKSNGPPDRKRERFAERRRKALAKAAKSQARSLADKQRNAGATPTPAVPE